MIWKIWKKRGKRYEKYGGKQCKDSENIDERQVEQ